MIQPGEKTNKIYIYIKKRMILDLFMLLAIFMDTKDTILFLTSNKILLRRGLPLPKNRIS